MSTKQGEVAIRLSADDLEAFLAEHGTQRPVSYGSVMQDFALVPPDIVANPAQLAAVIRRAHGHVDSLPAKQQQRPLVTPRTANGPLRRSDLIAAISRTQSCGVSPPAGSPT